MSCGHVLVVAVALIGGAVSARAADSVQTRRDDDQKVADGMPWNWADSQANVLYSLSQAGKKYDVVILSNHADRFELTFRFMDGDRQAYSWRGHRDSVFRLLGDRLYYVEFNPSASGGKVVAVDLLAGKELWRTPLRALGQIQHSAYRNRVAVEANADRVIVWGNESGGRYVEIKDARTGQTVGHKVFDAAPEAR